MNDIVKHLSNFPALLITAAAAKYPKACTLEPPEEDNDGTSGYEILDAIL
jgi:hypothetical protein